MAVVKQETQNLHEEFSGEVQLTWGTEATWRNMEAKWWKFKIWLVAEEVLKGTRTWNKCRYLHHCGEAVEVWWSTSWTQFHHQFQAVVNHNDWAAHEKAMHLIIILQGQAADILHRVPAKAAYEDITGILEWCYGDHQLSVAYWSQFRARI
jgi:hypothetical protein